MIKVVVIFMTIALMLTVATVVATAKSTKHPERDYSELHKRINTWWFIIAVLFLGLGFNETLASFIFALISFIAFKEFLTLSPVRRTDRSVLFLCYLSIPVQYYFVWIGWYGMFIIFIPVYVFVAIFGALVFSGSTKEFLRVGATLHWAVMMTIFSISHIPYLFALHPIEPNTFFEPALIAIYLVFLTQLNDVAQYVWGKSIGRLKIVPKVSPNKTLEGFLGGVFTTTVAALLIYKLLTPLSFSHALFSGVLIACFGFVGDIVLSAVKRDLGVKDTGTLLPGHGGILDRLDSIIFTGPLFFHFLRYFYC